MSKHTEGVRTLAPHGVIGRLPGDDEGRGSVRAPVRLAAMAEFDYTTGASGSAAVHVYRSEGDLDYGGMVLRLEIHNQEASFVPTATVIEDGVDLHIAGEAEAEALIVALQWALMKLNAERARRVGVEMD
ncbi:MAG: hypothetical protein R3F33_15070 [Planctomycetota bacterium]